MMQFAKARGVMLGLALLGLVGCNKPGMPGGSANGDAVASDADGREKLNGYIDGYNALLSTMGLQAQAKDYRESNIPHGAPGGGFRVSPGWINQGREKLQAARTLPGGSPEMDAAADALIASAGIVEAHLASLQAYYQGKKYLDDSFARGKAENAPMLIEIARAEKELAAFGKLLEAAIERRDLALLGKLKESDATAYNAKLALIHSKKLLDLFQGQANPARKELLVAGDVEVAAIEQAVADGRAEATRQGKDTRAFDMLTSMLGYYREFKADGDPSHLNTVLTYYNGAVEAANN